MIEPLRQVIEQIEQLDPVAQEEVADLLHYKLSELEKRAKRQEALERLYDQWEAELPEQLAELERGEHGRIYYSTEEFLAALNEIPYEPEEKDTNECQPTREPSAS